VAAVQFGILGALEVEDEAGAVAVRGKRRRALLCRLLVSPNQPVPVDLLAHDVWSGTPPPGAASTLASHVSLLRKALGPGLLDHLPGGYRLTVDVHQLDASAFEQELLAGQRSSRQAHPQRAADHLVRALGSWRGPALADVADAWWAQGEITRLEELRLGAEEMLLRARLDLGHHHEIAAGAEAAVGEQPLREERWAIYMLALYRSGRQAEALRAFQRLRSLLDEQLGVEPSPDLADLEQAIVLQSPELKWTPPAPDHQPVPVVPTYRDTVLTTLLLVRTRALVPASPGDPSAPDDPPTAADGRAGRDGDDDPAHDSAVALKDLAVRHGGVLDATVHSEQGVLAAFSSPAAALDAASALPAAAAVAATRRPGTALPHIGVAIGVVTVVDGTHSGGALDEVYSLCAVAGPGEVLVGQPIWAVLGRGGQLPLSERGTFNFSGLSGPLTVFALDWQFLRQGPATVPLADELRDTDATFVGRLDEQDRLDRLFRSAAEGLRQLVLIGGEPGIGKSTLAAAAARRVEASGGIVLYGRCLEVTNAPYQPFVEALDHWVRHASEALLNDHVFHYGGELSRLVPVLAQRVPGADAPATSDVDTERYLTFTATDGLLGRMAVERPVLLVLEDMHWADMATLQLLRHLMSRSQRTPVLVLATFRSNEITSDHPLSETFAALWRDANVTRIDLGGLSTLDIQDLCLTYAGGGADRGALEVLAADLRHETDGNPFFVCELLRWMAESGALVPTGDDPRARAPSLERSEIPPSLRDVIGQRVRRLGTKAERVLVLAAVIGTEFNLGTLARISDLEPEPLLDLLDRAVRSSILKPVERDGFVFAHALIRRTLYQELQPARCSRLHARVAAALEDGSVRPVVSGVVAHHYLAAGDQASALRWTERAGYDAFASMAPDDAALWFGHACSLLEELHPEERLRLADLTLQLGVAMLLAGRPAYRDVLLQAAVIAKAAGDGRRMALAALANTRGYYSAAGQIDHDRVDVLQESLALVEDGDDQLRARLTAALCSETAFGTSLDERRALADQAKGAARALGDPRTIVEVNNAVIEALRYPSELAQRLEDTAVAIELAEKLHDPSAVFWAAGHRMRTLVEAGMVVDALQYFDRMVEVSTEVGQPIMRWLVTFSTAQWAFLRGQTAVGEQLAEEAYGLGESIGQPDAFNYYATQLSHARWQQGRLHEIVDLIAEGARQNPGIPSYQGALCRALCQAGRSDEARALLDEANGTHFGDLPKDLLWTYGMVAFAEAAIRLDHSGAAATLYDQLAPFRDQVCFLGTTCEGPVAHYLGGLAAVLGRTEAAAGHFESAARFAERAGSPYFTARTSIEGGRLAARCGDLASARRLLTAGRDLADQGQFVAESHRALDGLARRA
jgi:DNA-binding SARP family transcriptional activator/tetratricopeptide (TPR) repeat protein